MIRHTSFYCTYITLGYIKHYHIIPILYLYDFTDIMIYIYLCTFLCVYILLLLSCFGFSQYILLLSIMPSSFYANHTTQSYDDMTGSQMALTM